MKEDKNYSHLIDFFEIAQAITSTLDIDALLKKIGRVAEQLTDTPASAIMLLDDEGKNLYFKVAGGEKGALINKLKVPGGEGIAGWVAGNREPLIVQDVKKDERFTGKVDKVSGFDTKSILCVPMILNNELIGVVEVLNKTGDKLFTEEDKIILTGLANFAATAIVNAKNNSLQQNFFTNVFEILTNAFESKSPMLSGHSFRVAQMSTAIARDLDISGRQYKDIYYAAVLHDIGFINVPEYSIIDHGVNKVHPVYGAEIVKNVILLNSSSELIKCHHEFLDGSGFPSGAKGGAIPFGAKIISIAESSEDMKFSGYSEEYINGFFKKQKGVKFEPAVVDAYIKNFE